MKKSKKEIFKLSCLIIYILFSVTLIVESCINGTDSTQQSNALGGTIADIFNDISGDQSKKIDPLSITIDNKIEKAHVGDTFKIQTTIFPKDATNTSKKYVSSDASIASVNYLGEIKCLKQGEVSISTYIEGYEHITDQFTFIIEEVNAEDFSISIKNAILQDNDTYILETNKTYEINNKFTPNNTTNKSLTYELLDNEFISKKNNLLTAIKSSFNRKIPLTATHKNISKTINLIVKAPYIHDIDDFYIDDLEIYVDQKINPIITFNPESPTFKDYTLSTNSNNLKIENNQIIGLNVSDNNAIKIKLKSYDLEKTFNVKVKPRETLQNFDLRVPYLVAGTKSKIYLDNIEPFYADLSSIEYKSENLSIAEIDQNGNINLLKEGSTNIIVSNGKITKTLPITVNKKENDNEFNIASSFNLIIDQTYNLDTLLQINNLPLDYFLIDNNFAKIENKTITTSQIGQTDLIITDKSSGFYQQITINSYDNFSITQDDNETDNISTSPNKEVIINLQDNNLQDYIFEAPSSIVINQITKNKYSLFVLEAGKMEINIYPAHCNNFFKTLEINSISTSLSSQNLLLGCNIIDSNYNIKMDNPNGISINRLANSLFLKPFAYSNTFEDEFLRENIVKLNANELSELRNKEIDLKEIDNINLEITSSDDKIVSITQIGDKWKIVPHSLGKVIITIKDTISFLKKEISIGSYNFIRIADNPYNLTGTSVKKVEENSYSADNNSSLKLELNFDKQNTTYFETTFTSSDENIATISQDGTITTLKTGTVIIHVLCYDGISPKTLKSGNQEISNYFECEITLEVQAKMLITDFNSFFLKVRKSIGHFGAFLVLGIFSSLTYLLYFDAKKWKLSLPINFVQGVTLATITEIIQLFVPGRVGSLSDVLIDSLGFLISSIIISAIFIIRFIQKKKKK